MTARTIDNLVIAAEGRMRTHPSERRGQAYYNTLAKFDGPLACSIAGTFEDPFHQDGNLDAFFTRVVEAWHA